MSVLIPRKALSNGNSIPIIGLGTWRIAKNDACRVVREAIELGYRHFDCAYSYQNEEEIGKALKKVISSGEVKREDLFITSKVWNTFHREEHVVQCCRKSLAALGLSYVDLYLIHWPFAYKEGEELVPKDEDGVIHTTEVDYLETWRGMERCYELGLAKSLGLSNFNSEQIERVLGNERSAKPVVLQIESHPYLPQTPLIEFCDSKGIVVTAYSPFGSPMIKTSEPKVIDDPKVKTIAKKYDKCPGQVLIKFHVQRNVAAIPGSTNPKHIAENIDIFDFTLSKIDMESLNGLNQNLRTISQEFHKDHKYYPFNAPF